MSRYHIVDNQNNNYPPEHRRVERSSFKSNASYDNNSSKNQDYATGWDEEPITDLVTNKKVISKIEQDAVLFVRGVLSEAITHDTSDVHFEPKRDKYKIRFRVDGILHNYVERDIEEYEAVLNAIKVLGGIRIAEHMIPQDGHIEMLQEEVVIQPSTGTNVPEGSWQPNMNKQNISYGDTSKKKQHYYDIRVSVFPAVDGEVVVMRILNRENAILSIEELGMDDSSLQSLNKMLMSSYGMFLITGPTGSGKTTTLYSLLRKLKSEEKNIITLEDPIEFHLDWLRQCEINDKRGFSFKEAMSSILRQDPDVLMVGEIRDAKTAEYAIRSALVGRIVGSTIHANTTIGTIARLIEFGIQRSILAHTIKGIIAQRLVRKVCKYCKEEYTPNPKHLSNFGLGKTDGPFYHGKGCEKCDNTGFSERVGIFSVMIFDDEVVDLLIDQKPLTEIQDYAIKNGMKTLKMDAVNKIKSGITTVEEVMRVI